MCEHAGIRALADPGGGEPGGPPPDPRFGGHSVQFKSKRMNFRALILYFFQNFLAWFHLA